MEIAAKILVAFVAIEHLYILFIEVFAWQTLGKKVFKNAIPDELFSQTKSLAANQGLYNGFLSAGLGWSFFISEAVWQTNISVFFLSCVILAGFFGAFTIMKKIFFTQALPAIIALIFVLLSR
ncbi:MAG: DUF1304 domain-containing protein [Sphingobacteriaceae bacterium]|nr:DUF1304 domain-containing protein [Sphingobacteriaceae bacterium]